MAKSRKIILGSPIPLKHNQEADNLIFMRHDVPPKPYLWQSFKLCQRCDRASGMAALETYGRFITIS
jgi:hypothetical protein